MDTLPSKPKPSGASEEHTEDSPLTESTSSILEKYPDSPDKKVLTGVADKTTKPSPRKAELEIQLNAALARVAKLETESEKPMANALPLGTIKDARTKMMGAATVNRGPSGPLIVAHGTAVPPTDGCGMLQSIPGELLTRILTYISNDIPSLEYLASTSTSNQMFLCNGCQFLWTDIDFGKVPSAKALQLMDSCLHALLTNVNAQRVTKLLCLYGCTAIRGAELAALMYSAHSAKCMMMECMTTGKWIFARPP